MLKKNYRELLLWMLGFTAMMTCGAFLPIRDVGLLVRVLDNVATVSCAVLMLIIWKTEKVFFFSGVSFEEAVEAGSDRRRAYAWRHVKLFGIFAAAFLLYSVVAQLLHVTVWADIAVIIVGIGAVALYSVRFRL